MSSISKINKYDSIEFARIDQRRSQLYPRANGAKRRSGRKPGARDTNSARLFTPG